ncbi:MAG: hypothetical protein JXR47_06620 [Thiotrichales bacterium]|nr:hypothetical protein [Thiotrichales bacterium]
MKDIKEYKLVEGITHIYWNSDLFFRYLLRSIYENFFVGVVVLILLFGFGWSLWLWWDDIIADEPKMFGVVGFYEVSLVICSLYAMRQYSKKIITNNELLSKSRLEIKQMVGTDERAIFHIDSFLKKVKKSDSSYHTYIGQLLSDSQLRDKVVGDQLRTIIQSMHESNIKTVTKTEKVFSDPVLWGITSLIVAFVLSAITINSDDGKAILLVTGSLFFMSLLLRVIGLLKEDETLRNRKAYLAFSLLKKVELQSE